MLLKGIDVHCDLDDQTPKIFPEHHPILGFYNQFEANQKTNVSFFTRPTIVLQLCGKFKLPSSNLKNNGLDDVPDLQFQGKPDNLLFYHYYFYTNYHYQKPDNPLQLTLGNINDNHHRISAPGRINSFFLISTASWRRLSTFRWESTLSFASLPTKFSIVELLPITLEWPILRKMEIIEKL